MNVEAKTLAPGVDMLRRLGHVYRADVFHRMAAAAAEARPGGEFRAMVTALRDAELFDGSRKPRGGPIPAHLYDSIYRKT